MKAQDIIALFQAGGLALDGLLTITITASRLGDPEAVGLLSFIRRTGLLHGLGVASTSELLAKIGALEGVRQADMAQTLLDDINEPGPVRRVPGNVRRAVERLVADGPMGMDMDGGEFTRRQMEIAAELAKAEALQRGPKRGTRQ